MHGKTIGSTHMGKRMYTYGCTHSHTHACVYTHICTQMDSLCTQTCMHTHMNTRTQMDACIHAHTHTCVHTRIACTHTHTHIHTHTHTQTNPTMSPASFSPLQLPYIREYFTYEYFNTTVPSNREFKNAKNEKIANPQNINPAKIKAHKVFVSLNVLCCAGSDLKHTRSPNL